MSGRPGRGLLRGAARTWPSARSDPPRRAAGIGLRDSWNLRNGLGVNAPHGEVLAALGDCVEDPGTADCCGAAGTYAVLRRRDNRCVLAAKIAASAQFDLDFWVVVNPGCQRRPIAVSRARLRTRVVHLSELVAKAQTAYADR